MTPARPTSVTVIAVLNMLFGGLTLSCGMQALGNPAGLDRPFFGGDEPPPGADKPFDDEAVRRQLQERLPPYHATIARTETYLDLALSVLMIASGIGLMKMRPWGRYLAMLAAVLSLVIKLASILYAAFVVIPAMREMIQLVVQQFAPLAQDEQQRAFVNWFVMSLYFILGLTVIWPILTLAYPLVALAVMLLPATAKAFRGETVFDPDADPREPPDDRDHPRD